MNVIQIILVLISLSCFICLGMFAFLALKGESPIILSTRYADLMKWKHKAFCIFAGIGFLVCMYQGADAMLFWMPGSWGSIDEYGDFRPYRSAIAGLFAFTAGFAFIEIIVRSVRDNILVSTHQNHLNIIIRLLNSKSHENILTIKNEIIERINKLEEDNAKCHIIYPVTQADIEIKYCRDILSIMQKCLKKN